MLPSRSVDLVLERRPSIASPSRSPHIWMPSETECKAEGVAVRAEQLGVFFAWWVAVRNAEFGKAFGRIIFVHVFGGERLLFLDIARVLGCYLNTTC